MRLLFILFALLLNYVHYSYIINVILVFFMLLSYYIDNKEIVPFSLQLMQISARTFNIVKVITKRHFWVV